MFLFFKNKFVTQIFVTWIVYWFTKKNNKACLYVIDICISYPAIELESIWFLWIGIWNLYYAKKETLSQAFSYKFCEFLHNDDFWYFLRIILQVFRWLLLDVLFFILFFVDAVKIINLIILKLYPVKLTRISFLMKLRFILSDYCTA